MREPEKSDPHNSSLPQGDPHAQTLTEGYAKTLEAMAKHQRFNALLAPPRDYVPTEEELALERAPMLMVADALDAGAACLRRAGQQTTSVAEAREHVKGAMLSYVDACERDLSSSRKHFAKQDVELALDALIAACLRTSGQQMKEKDDDHGAGLAAGQPIPDVAESVPASDGPTCPKCGSRQIRRIAELFGAGWRDFCDAWWELVEIDRQLAVQRPSGAVPTPCGHVYGDDAPCPQCPPAPAISVPRSSGATCQTCQLRDRVRLVCAYPESPICGIATSETQAAKLSCIYHTPVPAPSDPDQEKK